VLAAREVDIHRTVELHARFEVFNGFERGVFCVRAGEFATGIASAGDDAPRQRGRFTFETERRKFFRKPAEILVGDVRYDDVLPDGEA
jgi:hypothetical protein